MIDSTIPELYLQSKTNITTLVTDQNQHTRVPACPDWTIRDVLGHLVGSFEDVAAGNIEDLGQPHWTASQVERYADLSLEGILRRWDEVITASGDRFTEIAALDLPDIATHEFDIRGALGNTANRDAPILIAILPFFSDVLSEKLRDARLPTLTIHADGEQFTLGDGQPQGELHISAFDLNRIFTGRRSKEQIRGLGNGIDLDAWIDYLAVMSPRESDLIE